MIASEMRNIKSQRRSCLFGLAGSFWRFISIKLITKFFSSDLKFSSFFMGHRGNYSTKQKKLNTHTNHLKLDLT